MRGASLHEKQNCEPSERTRMHLSPLRQTLEDLQKRSSLSRQKQVNDATVHSTFGSKAMSKQRRGEMHDLMDALHFSPVCTPLRDLDRPSAFKNVIEAAFSTWDDAHDAGERTQSTLSATTETAWVTERRENFVTVIIFEREFVSPR